MEPMLEQIEERVGRRPEEHLTDGGFATVDDIEKVSQGGTKVYTPIKEEERKRAKGIDPFQPLKKDSPAVAEWRQRMGTEEAKAVYKLRAQAAEWTNAQARNRGFYQVNVRGLQKGANHRLMVCLGAQLVVRPTTPQDEGGEPVCSRSKLKGRRIERGSK